LIQTTTTFQLTEDLELLEAAVAEAEVQVELETVDQQTELDKLALMVVMAVME
jgi:hypothetical protein